MIPETLDITADQKVSYCVPLWVRDEQIKLAIARVKGRIAAPAALRTAPVAVVCYGPSLNETWAQVRDFPYIISCSGSHQFLRARGITPTWHVDVDPRAHKATLLGTPHPDVEYWIASTCHPALFDLLEGFNVKLWHVFATEADALRTLPRGEWALTGGSSVGLRALTIARFLGFTELHVFGMDGSDGPSGKHAAAHPLQAPQRIPVDYQHTTYYTTPAFLACAKQTFHELDQMPDVRATFYGEGLVQAMARDYVPHRVKPLLSTIAFVKDPVISEAHRALNRQLHADEIAYGVGSMKHVDTVQKLAASVTAASILDYGCGKGYLAKALPMPIWEYDPAVPGKDEEPRPADLVVCTDVLEHVEPDTLQAVLADLGRCVRKLGYFIIHTGAARKTYANGQNTHLIQEGRAWWEPRLAAHFTVAKIFEKGIQLHVLVTPFVKKKKAGPPTLHVDAVEWRREPYAIGVVANPVEAELYATLAASFPPLSIFADVSSAGGNKKYSLSEVNHREQYHAFLQGCAPWKAFYDAIKAPAFQQDVFAQLARDGVFTRVPGLKYKTRFEFSLLPADGGCLRPHTDLPSKVVTIVLTMLPTEGDWRQTWGGGTLVLKPRDGAVLEDYKADLDRFDIVGSYPYVPNQATVFVKTANSWHAVGPMAGTGEAMRKTVTINIERQP